MAFRTNAEGKDQERAATRYAAHVGPKAKEKDYSVVFSTDGVLVVENGEKFNFTEDEFYRWIDAACPRDASGPIDILPLEGVADEGAATGANVSEADEPAEPEPAGLAEIVEDGAAIDSAAEPVAGDVVPAEVVDGVESARPTGVVDTGDDGGAGSEPELEVSPETTEVEGAGDPDPRLEGIIERTDLRNAFHELVRDAFEVLRQEHAGEIGRNVARLRKGQVMTVVEQFKARAKEQQLEGLTTTKEILGALNSGLIAFANSHGIVDRFNRITENEATITRTVFERFTDPERGINSTFRMVDAIDEATGEEIVNDAGEPIEVPISEVAVNNLYPLAEYATPANRDNLASFAHRFSEKVVKAAKKYSKDRSIPMLEVIGDINGLRRAVPSPITEEEVSVQADEGLALDWIRQQRGEEPPSELVSIVTERAWVESVYDPMKAVASLAYSVFGLPVDNSTGLISNVKLLERTIGQYFNIAEYGPGRLIGALVDAGDISEEQGKLFLARYQWDAEEGKLVEQEISEEDAQALAAAIATGEGEVPDDEFESDTFNEELDLDVEHEPEFQPPDTSDGLDVDDDF